MSPSLRNFHWLATLSVILGLVFLYEVIPPVPIHIGSAALFALGSRAIAFAVMEAVLGLIALIFLKAQRKGRYGLHLALQPSFVWALRFITFTLHG